MGTGSYALQGVALGFAAGVAPGPMLGLVIGQSLRRGWRAGSVVALAPLCSDALIIALLMLALGRLPANALPIFSLLGALVLLYLGVETLRSSGQIADAGLEGRPLRLLAGAVLTNLLNPHPYLFWASVGGALLLRGAHDGGAPSVVAFLAAFYALLVGSKLVIAVLLGRGRGLLNVRAYRVLITGSGLLLLGVAALLAVEGVVGLR